MSVGGRRIGIERAPEAVVALRVVSSLAWLQSALVGKDAKLAPSFLNGAGLAERAGGAFSHTAIAPWVVTFLHDVVVPHAQVFALLVAFGDLAIGISLALGLFARAGAAGEIARCAVNVLVAGGAGADTIGFNVMLATAGIITIATAAGRARGLDGVLQRRMPAARALRVLG